MQKNDLFQICHNKLIPSSMLDSIMQDCGCFHPLFLDNDNGRSFSTHFVSSHICHCFDCYNSVTVTVHMKVLSSFISERDIYLATWPRERVILRICAFVRGHSNFSQRTRSVRRVFTLNTMSHLAAATVLLLALRFFLLCQERMKLMNHWQSGT